MSLSTKNAVSAFKAVESQIRCTIDRVTWAGNQLSPKNRQFLADLYTVMAGLWLDVSHEPALINRRWVQCLTEEPLESVIEALKDIDFVLISDRFRSYGSFKHYLRLNYPRLGQFFAPLRRNFSTFYSSGEGLPRIRTALRFATRANLPDPMDLEEEAWYAWQETNLRPWNEVNVDREREIISQLFTRQEAVQQIHGFVGQFGPGSSAGLTNPSIADKYHDFSDDPLLRIMGYRCGFHPHEMPRIKKNHLDRTHDIQFVPKQLDKLRTVSMEPCSLMFYQLGASKSILKMIEDSPWRRHIDLKRADLNQDLAWLGSLDGSYATIDLSSASDLVKNQLVKALTIGSALYSILQGTRSFRARYNGELYKPEYFAPMGSGLCFTVECIVFASIVESVMRRNHDRRAWRVYGDDIIVPTERYDEVVSRLEYLGFDVNAEKSFSDPRASFRESCGGDYYKGENVRPVYVSRFWPGLPRRRSSVPTIESNIDLANRLFDYKLTRLRLIESLKQVRPAVLFDDTGEHGLFSKCPTNYHTKVRYNVDYQREEYLVGRSITRSEPAAMEDEDIRLFEFLRGRACSSAVEAGETCSIVRERHPIWGKVWDSPSPGWRGRKAIDESREGE